MEDITKDHQTPSLRTIRNNQHGSEPPESSPRKRLLSKSPSAEAHLRHGWPYLHEMAGWEARRRSRLVRRPSKPSGPLEPTAWRCLSDVSVSGVAAILDPHSPLLRRLLWGGVLAVCFALMLAQIVNRVLHYLSEPVTVNVRVTRNATLEYPAITVCNKNSANRSAVTELFTEHGFLPETSADMAVSQLVGVDGLTPTVLWTKLAHSIDIFVSSCWFGRGVKCQQRGTWSMVHTVLGPCYTFTLNARNVKDMGWFHQLFLRLHETTPIRSSEGSGVRILIHERSEPAVLAVLTRGVNIELGCSREVKLELRKFHILNSKKTPCVEDESYSQAWCQLACFERLVLVAARCRLPFMSEQADSLNVSECATPAAYETAKRATRTLIYSGGWTANCSCPRPCHRTSFQMYPDTAGFYSDQVKARVYYSALVFEHITEELAYPLISLLCDIGATLGLLMGASVLTVCELIEVAASRLATCTPPAVMQTMPSPVARPRAIPP